MSSEVHSRVYQSGVPVADDIAVHEVSEWIAQPDTVVWVDLCHPTAEDLTHLRDELGLHELAVEDALSPHQRPKLDRYEDHLFLSMHATSVDVDGRQLVETEVDAFVGDRWIITVRKGPEFDIRDVTARWDRSDRLAKAGVAYLLYGLLDVVVDGYFATLDAFDGYFDEVSDSIFAETPIDQHEQLEMFQMRRALVRFHRLAVPMREAVSSLMRREHMLIPEDLYPYYQDIYDHVLRVTEATDALRDLVTTIVETNLSMRDFRQNQVMKKVTSWAAIIAVPTLITGFYGMNVPYPGFANDRGTLSAVILMGLLSGFLYLQFKKREWL